MFFSINELFIPGLACVFASIYTVFSMFAMCCAGKCCCYPTEEDGVQEGVAGLAMHWATVGD